MSVSLWPALPVPEGGPSDHESAGPRERQTGPRLHLVDAHEHVWQLRAVEYDDALEVRRYECEACDDVLFR